MKLLGFVLFLPLLQTAYAGDFEYKEIVLNECVKLSKVSEKLVAPCDASWVARLQYPYRKISDVLILTLDQSGHQVFEKEIHKTENLVETFEFASGSYCSEDQFKRVAQIVVGQAQAFYESQLPFACDAK